MYIFCWWHENKPLLTYLLTIRIKWEWRQPCFRKTNYWKTKVNVAHIRHKNRQVGGDTSDICVQHRKPIRIDTFKRDQFIGSFFGIVVTASTQIVRQLIKVVFVWMQFTLVFDNTIIIFIYFERIKYNDSENLFCWLASNNFIPVSVIAKWNSWSSSMLLKGKIFSLHILQYQSAPVLTTVNSSQENWVQFLWTFLWQQLQSIKYKNGKIVRCVWPHKETVQTGL